VTDQRFFGGDLAQSFRLMDRGDCAGAMRYAKLAFLSARKKNDSAALARSMSQIAWCCMRLGDPEAGLECAVAARRLWSQLDDAVELARIEAVETFLLLDSGLSDDAFEMATLAVATAESGDDPAVLAFALNARGVTLAVCRQVSMAVPLLERAISVAAGAGTGGHHAFALLNLGFCYMKLAEEAEAHEDAASMDLWLDRAVAATTEAIAAAEDFGDLWILRVALGNCAEMYALRGDVTSAMSHLDRSASVPGEGGASLRIHYLYTLAKARLRSGDLDGAEEAARQSLDLADETGQIDHQLNAASQLGSVLEARGRFEEALAFQKRYHALYVRQSGETTHRLAKAAELRAETRELRARASALAAEALMDALTGMPNRRSFERKVEDLAGSAYALAIVDLDHFKSVNDQYSHLVGDDVLRRVSRTLEAHMAELGFAARLGGEEFVLLLPHCDTEAAVAVVENVRLALRDINWGDVAPGLLTTASVGLCSTAETSHHTDIMITADMRLYAAKRSGRDRTVWRDADQHRQAV
jgi:diguanylate cyclase (GGDEF)-like protein